MKTHVAGNLAAELTSFVGRRSELRHARELISSARQMTFTGPGGVGKSRLARRFAYETQRAFPHGTWLVELADLRDGDLVPLTVANTLGVRNESADLVDRLIEHLRDKQLLLVMDNCEHLADSCAAVINKLLLACPGVKVVATSRHVLGVEGEQVFQVPPLDHGADPDAFTGELPGNSDALSLFEDRAMAADTTFRITDRNRAMASAICQRLDGVPLAIELAAVRVRSFTVEEISDRLDDALHLLTTGERTRTPRQRTIEAAIRWSFDQCSATEQTLWARLSVFSGGFTTEAAAQVCVGDGIDTGTVHETISSLVDKSIVRRTTGNQDRHARFDMLELMRQFGAARLSATGAEKKVRRVHRDLYQRLARRSDTDYFSPHDVEWFGEVRQELANLRAALEFSVADPAEARHALDMAAALRPFWYHEGFLLEGYRWLTKALRTDTAATPVRARALAAASFLGVLLEDVDSARKMLTECRRLAAKVHAEDAASEAILSEALLTALNGDLDASLARSEAAGQAALAAGHRGLAAEAFAAASVIAFVAEQPQAANIAQRYLELTEEHKAHLLKAPALWLVGLNHWRHDDQTLACKHLREAIILFMEFDQPGLIAACFEGLAWSAEADGDHERAARLLGSAKRVWQFSQMRLAQDLTRQVGEAVEDAVRKALGEAAFARAMSVGQAWSSDQAREYALTGRSSAPQQAEKRPSPTTLTRRELEVAQLVASGLTNKEIGSELVISTRTADSHVDHILRKLGFRSRTQIAKWIASS